MVALPGSGWPGDPADPSTPVASGPDEVEQLAASADTLSTVDARVSVCRACPRLVSWREGVAATKRRAYADEPYWGRPVPGFGAGRPGVLIVGLAPGAHGANRTGRNFTGDRSGEWLYASLYRCGLANQPTAVSADDGLMLLGARVVATVRCAPPDNKPTPAERDTCRPWLTRELELVWPSVRAVVVLGAFGWAGLWPALRRLGVPTPRPVPKFGHGAEVALPGGPVVLGCYHVSQQNTFTGRLTEAMLDAVFTRAAELAGAGRGYAHRMSDTEPEFTPDRSRIDISRDPTPGVPDHLRADDEDPGFDVSRDPTPGVADHAAPDDEDE